MKKVLSILLVFVMVLVLSGCRETVSESRCGDNGVWHQTTLTPSNEGYCIYDDYYTQEEVDEMLSHLAEDDTENYVDNLNKRVYELESELRDFERFEYEDLLEFEEYFYSEWLDDLEEYLGETYYTKDELDEGFEDVRLYLEDLQAQIADLQAQIDELNETK